MSLISVVINTAALGTQSGNVLSSGGITHDARIEILEETLARLTRDPLVHEVVVSGEWREPRHNESWRYVETPSVRFDCTDALLQRQRGAEQTTGDLLVFLHDDHYPARDFFPLLQTKAKEDWDVLVPRRLGLEGKDTHTLNNGAPNYVMGHCSVLRRFRWRVVPWDHVPPVFQWDVCHTLQLRDAGSVIRFDPDLIVYDAEAELGATPWA